MSDTHDIDAAHPQQQGSHRDNSDDRPKDKPTGGRTAAAAHFAEALRELREADGCERLTGRDRERLGRLWRVAFPRIQRLAARLFKNPADADELVGRFAELLSRPDQFRKCREARRTGGVPFMVFATARLRSLAKDVRKQRAWRFAGMPVHDEQAVTDFNARHPASAIQAAPGCSPDAASEAATGELRRAVRQAVARLPRTERRAVLAMELCPATQRELEQRLGVGDGTLGKRRRRALDRLREVLAAFAEAPDGADGGEADLCRRVLSLREQCVSNRQIARRLGVTYGAVQSALARTAIERLPDGGASVRLWVATDAAGAVCYAATEYARVKDFASAGHSVTSIRTTIPASVGGVAHDAN